MVTKLIKESDIVISTDPLWNNIEN
jgi:hypothetical protein